MRRNRIHVSSGTYWSALATLPRRMMSQIDQIAWSTLCWVACFFFVPLGAAAALAAVPLFVVGVEFLRGLGMVLSGGLRRMGGVEGGRGSSAGEDHALMQGADPLQPPEKATERKVAGVPGRCAATRRVICRVRRFSCHV
jgi:hypothetical protein